MARMRAATARTIAAAYLDGVWEVGAMAARAAYDLGVEPADWLRHLAHEIARVHPDRPVDQPRALQRLVAGHPLFLVNAPALVPSLSGTTLVPTAMAAHPRWPVLDLDTVGDLAGALGLGPTQLDAYADVRSLERHATDEALRHYRYRWVTKPAGGARLLEAPKPTLKALQRLVLREILDAIPPHPAAHGFRLGRSIHSFVRPHVARGVLIGLDLEAFFTAVTPGRVFGILRVAGYPEPVAHTLTGLLTNAVPAAVLRRVPVPPPHLLGAHHRMRTGLAHPHLPQGAPTSPALANLAAHGLDRRLAGLADRIGARYTRYADDLAFSGPSELAAGADRLARVVTRIAAEEGFRVNPRKTRVATQNRQQRLGGQVVNTIPNVARREVDRLRAILHDAASNGPAAANRDGHTDLRAHLGGRISWVAAVNPSRGARLQQTFDRIDWAADP